MSTDENAASLKESDAPAHTADCERRIVLVGKTGSGRSSSGNTILGRSLFGTETSPCSVTLKCKKQTGQVDDKWSLSVVDTPGYYHTSMTLQDVITEVGQCIKLYSLGPHAFLLTMALGRFTQEERDCLDWIKATFGAVVTQYTLVLFTCGDRLHGKRVEDFIEDSDELSGFVNSCRGGYHVINNSSTESSEQVVELMKKIDKMVAENKGGYYSKEVFEEAEKAMKEVQERIMGENVNGMSAEKANGDQKVQSEDDMEARKRAERLFWCELVTAVGKGAAEGAGIVGKNKGKGKAVKKVAALAVTPMSISSAAKVVGGAVREGSKVLYKHRKTFLH